MALSLLNSRAGWGASLKSIFNITVAVSMSLGQVVSAQSSNLPLPRYLKVWNESFTHQEALARLKQLKLSADYQAWYTQSSARQTLHRSSIEFMGRDQFFLKSEKGGLNMIHTGRITEGQILIGRKPFNFTADEPTSAIAKRLQELGGVRDVTYWAPLLAVIDVERQAERKEAAMTRTQIATKSAASNSRSISSDLRQESGPSQDGLR